MASTTFFVDEAEKHALHMTLLLLAVFCCHLLLLLFFILHVQTSTGWKIPIESKPFWDFSFFLDGEESVGDKNLLRFSFF